MVDLPTVDLLLIPTVSEWRLCEHLLADYCQPEHLKVEICGWGLIQSGIRTMASIGKWSPKRIWLIGIAGSFTDDLQVGQAYEFSTVSIEGVGVGTGDRHRSFESLKWSERFGDEPLQRETLSLDSGLDKGRPLLSVCSASADRREADKKSLAFPGVLAEDMESYAVAWACGMGKVPLRIVRGISNRAGDRDPRNWRSEEAMVSAFELFAKLSSCR